eukprot:356232-Chlamydomonas_euryale.AAC.19
MVCGGADCAPRSPFFVPTPQPPLPAFFFTPPVELPPPKTKAQKAEEEAAAVAAVAKAAEALQPNPNAKAVVTADEAWTLPPVVQVVRVDMAGSKFLYEVVPVAAA